MAFVSIFVVITIVFIVDITKSRHKNSYNVFFLFLLGLTLFFSRDVNTDYSAYLIFYDDVAACQFNEILELSIISGYEIGFSVLLKLLSILHLAPSIAILTLNLIVISAYMYVFSKFQGLQLQILTIYLSTFYLFNELVQIRQGITSVLFTLSLYFFYRKSKLSLIFIISPFFHVSSVLGFTSYFVGFIKERKYYICGILISVLFGFGVGTDFILDFFVENLYLPEKIKSYHYSIYGLGFDIISLRYIRLLSVSLLILILWDRIRDEGFLFLLSRVYLLGVMASIVFSDFYILAVRLPQMFVFFEIFIIPYIINYFIPNRKVASATVFLISLILFFKNTPPFL